MWRSLCLSWCLAWPLAGWAFGFDDVAALARQQAAAPWQAAATPMPPALADLSYDEAREIRYRPDHAVWHGGDYELQFFHRGYVQRDLVAVHLVEGGQVRRMGYDSAAWDFGQLGSTRGLSPEQLNEPGPAGFRIHHALNDPAYKDELVVFLGASYFRALGRGQRYGLSARALALDTVGGGPEEFPRFTAFWIERPAPGADGVTVLALLDSPRASGAWQFVVRPGENTVMDVRARLFLRAPVAMLGLAPLTSMYQHGENQPRPGDFRPEVHDSDGLSIAADGEWLWRPLVNPGAPLASSFEVRRLEGFGLMQRDRRFAAYEDDEAHYERRPSAWVEPVGDWGPGRVVLLQLPTPDETHDNIVAAWQPARQPAPGEALDIAYRLYWQGEQVARPATGWTVQSRRGRGWAAPQPGELQFIVDFDGPTLRALAADGSADAAVKPVITPLANARVLQAHAWRHPAGGWRMALRVQRPDPAQPMELRAFLQHGAQALTETWTALIPQD
ncbi:MAG: glucan biosynthesis protein G [Burkholderiaceae bacterium]|nr:glucan biosynthesis protein G [Burkholderiaceae bacterium]